MAKPRRKATRAKLAIPTALPPRRSEIPPGKTVCDFCTAKCCRYFCLQIDTPTTWDDYDQVRWFLAHGRTLVYVDDGKWYLLVYSECNYLQPDNRCGIYEDRPKICREYDSADCEYDSEWTFDRSFETPEALWEYAHTVLKPRRKPKAAKVRPKAAKTAAPAPANPLAILNNPPAPGLRRKAGGR